MSKNCTRKYRRNLFNRELDKHFLTDIQKTQLITGNRQIGYEVKNGYIVRQITEFLKNG